MEITYKRGDLLDADEIAIVHGCNAQGVMGSGVAKQIRERFPEAYTTYLAMKEYGGMKLGGVSFASFHDVDDNPTKYVFNAITQEFYGRNPNIVYVSYDAIGEAFSLINDFCKEYNIKEIAMPKIGAGLANGDWDRIKSIIEFECSDVKPIVYLWEGE